MNTIITIGRQCGSGGREIGNKLSELLGIKCYDKELLQRAAKESGLSEEIMKNNDEVPTSSFLYNLVMDSYGFGSGVGGFTDMPLSNKVFLAQFDAIKKIADEGPCIMVGRCSDYALAERDNVLNIFVYADLEQRIERIMKVYNVNADKAKDVITKKDKQRASYYNFYTSKKWGRADSYDLCINSSVLGIDGSAKLISQYIQDFETRVK